MHQFINSIKYYIQYSYGHYKLILELKTIGLMNAHILTGLYIKIIIITIIITIYQL